MSEEREHKAFINNGAVQSFMRFLPESVAKDVVKAIARREITNVFIRYGEKYDTVSDREHAQATARASATRP